MDLTPLVAVLTIALFVGGMALWIYAVLHPLLNHAHLRIAFLSLFLFPARPGPVRAAPPMPRYHPIYGDSLKSLQRNDFGRK